MLISPAQKWPTLILLCLAELFVMAVWFSASAVVPALTAAWALDESGRSWLTMSVQIGFVAGTLASALLNLADRIPARRFFTISSLCASLSTLLIPLFATGLALAIPLRFLTGVFLAGVYPVGMKIMATWTQKDRGLGIGMLVGALTVGSASPHLLNSLGGVSEWRTVLVTAAGSAALGGLIAALFVDEGPYKTPAPRFNWKYIGEIARKRELVLANFGYLGHMWELYAMWAWIPVFLAGSFAIAGIETKWASLVSFVIIGIGGLGSVITGIFADRFGRTTLTIASLILSGLCSLTVGFLYGGNPFWLAGVCLVWGFAVVADSAQFSACVSELCRTEYTGTALTLQTSLGFLLTLVTIRLIPAAEQLIGWRWAFSLLAVGPAIGIWAMVSLRKLVRM